MRPRFLLRLRLDDPELLNLCLRVRQRPCPHCQSTGGVIRHGYSKGYQADGHQPHGMMTAWVDDRTGR